ncbi:transglutaminase domain-containing protein [Paenibacillus daejeonensis]|uniref:transglutaminase domain-containing protein n=1 Tax=Paenibacillus daejeonensis TaxID=135193 RepID=UPI0003733E8A|nr:transglutaminase domain-containing protein [Paenibacillus daejeonensis]
MRKFVLRAGVLLAVIAVLLALELKFEFVTADSSAVTGNAGLEQAIYTQLSEHATDFTITYSGNSSELFGKLPQIIQGAMAKDDYIAYIVDSYQYSIQSWSQRSKIKMVIEYRESVEQTAYVDERVNAIIADMIKPEMNAHQRVKAINDWIVLNVAYDESLQSYTAYEALADGRAVCQGYSLLAYKMLQAADVPNRIVEGTVDTGNHAWNLVNVNGAWYHLDVTWNDPVPDQLGEVSYAYYLKTDEELRKDHAWTRSYPAAVTPYAETLGKLSAKDPSRQAFYQELEQELGLHWLKPANMAANANDLTSWIRTAIAKGETTFKVRYLRGDTLKADIDRAMRSAGGIASYELSYRDYSDDGSVLLDVKFSLHR